MSNYNVNSSATDALAYGERQGWIIENRSDVNISFVFDGTDVTSSAGANPGITLLPGARFACTAGARDMTTAWNKLSVIHNSTGNKVLFVSSW